MAGENFESDEYARGAKSVKGKKTAEYELRNTPFLNRSERSHIDFYMNRDESPWGEDWRGKPMKEKWDYLWDQMNGHAEAMVKDGRTYYAPALASRVEGGNGLRDRAYERWAAENPFNQAELEKARKPTPQPPAKKYGDPPAPVPLQSAAMAEGVADADRMRRRTIAINEAAKKKRNITRSQ